MKRHRLLTIFGLFLLSMCQAAKNADGVELSRGRQILLNRGLQLQSLAYPNTTFEDFPRWTDAGFTTLNTHVWSYPLALQSLPAGQQWSRAYEPSFPITEFLSAAELPYANNLVTYLYGDELTDAQYADPVVLADMAAHYATWRQQSPNALVGTNGRRHIPNDANLANYMLVTQPDLIMFDYYPGFSSFRNFSNSSDPTPTENHRDRWYIGMQKYRQAGLAGNDGTGTMPIPYAQYLNLYRENILDPLPNESFVRLQQNASWAFGYTSVDAFVYTTVTPDVASVMFSTTDDSAPTVVFDYVKETNRQSRNLGPALVRMVSTGIFMQPGSGQDLPSLPLEIPGTTISAWSAHAGNTAGYTDYITGIMPTVSQGGATDTNYGDILVGYFKPLLADNSGFTFADGLHFMIVNGATRGGAAGSGIPVDANGIPNPAAMQAGSAAALAQWYTITFDFAGSDFDSLVRLSRDTGEVESVTLTPTGGSTYSFNLYLEGGTGDLFAFWNSSRPLPTINAVPGDFDSDGDVDRADFVAWQTTFPKASGATLAQGDADLDGDVDGADFVVWQTHFPYTPGASSAPVPEPTGISLAIFSSVMLGLLFSCQSLIPQSRRFARATI